MLRCATVAAVLFFAACGVDPAGHSASSVDLGCGADTDRDPRNCGACGTVCPAGTICLGGNCGCPPSGGKCSAPQSCCGTVGCVSLMSDIRNCGGCGVRCPDGVQCVNGACAGATPSSVPPSGFCTCADGCANDPTRECVTMDCCWSDYKTGSCRLSTSCGIWTYQ